MLDNDAGRRRWTTTLDDDAILPAGRCGVLVNGEYRLRGEPD
ncbi:MAG: hypothetical protein WBV06_18900 [Acidimicrobiia bacterium]|jgi:hypothetical protein